jgi:quinone-modifying oxidoreductase, subunit QmoB
LAGQPGEFTATFKKPGEKIEFDVPYPLPPEMRVDASGKELDAETCTRNIWSTMRVERHFDPRSQWRAVRCRGAGGRLAAGHHRRGCLMPIWASATSPDVVTNAQFEALAKKGKIVRPSDGKSQIGGLYPEPRQG